MAVSALLILMDRVFLRRHPLVPCRERRLRLPRDFVVLEDLSMVPFEPLESASKKVLLRWLSLHFKEQGISRPCQLPPSAWNLLLVESKLFFILGCFPQFHVMWFSRPSVLCLFNLWRRIGLISYALFGFTTFMSTAQASGVNSSSYLFDLEHTTGPLRV